MGQTGQLWIPPVQGGENVELSFQAGDTTYMLAHGFTGAGMNRRHRALALALLRLAVQELEQQETQESVWVPAEQETQK